MPLEVLGPLAVLTAGMKALPGAALLKTSGAAVAAKGTGIFAAKNKAVFAATHPGTSSGTSASHEALEKAKTELQKAASDIEEAENTTKSMMPLGLLTAFGFGGKQDDTVAALRRARARSHHGDDRRVRLSTVPDRCSSYGDFLHWFFIYKAEAQHAIVAAVYTVGASELPTGGTRAFRILV